MNLEDFLFKRKTPNCKHLCIKWHENGNIEEYDSLQDFCKKCNISYTTGQRWIHKKLKRPLPFEIYYLKDKNINENNYENK